MITRVEIKNFTVFEDIAIDFCNGVNILIGENGTGKTHLLKALYSALRLGSATKNSPLPKLCKYFNGAGGNGYCDEMLVRNKSSLQNMEINTIFDFRSFYIKYIYDYDDEGSVDYGNWDINDGKKEDWSLVARDSVFIPAKEMLSHANGLLSLDREREIPFDKTLIDIVAKAELGESKNNSEFESIILKKISEKIDGKVIHEKGTFYVLKNNGLKVEYSFEAEGFRKFGLLWKLIRNGLIRKNDTLFWDEPEANLNPQLIPTLVDILLELSRNGVQVFLATHNYSFTKYFEVNKAKQDNVVYHSLYKTKDGVQCTQATKYREIENNAIEQANTMLYNDIIDKAVEDIENE